MSQFSFENDEVDSLCEDEKNLTHRRIVLIEWGRLLCDASDFETVRHL